MDTIVLKGRKIVGGKVQGEALVSREDICFLSVDCEHGIITERNHELEGVSFAGKILVYPSGKGSTGGSYTLYDLARHNVAPKAIINFKAEPITATGAIIAEIPMIDKVDNDLLGLIETGDVIDLDAAQGKALVYKKSV